MPQSIVINGPSTVYVHFPQEMPHTFEVYDSTGALHYVRYLNGRIPRIKFRMPLRGNYTTNVPIVIDDIVPIEIPDAVKNPILPVAERDRWKPFRYEYNPDLTTIARIDTSTGVIEHGPRYKALTKPMQIFIDEHEKAHMFYRSEDKCDLYALVNFIRMGWNESTAYYALATVLKRSAQQIDRTRSLYMTISSTIQSNFSPGI